jgi:integrase
MPRQRENAPGPAQEVIAPMQKEPSQRRRRHVPQPKAAHVYWSETATGKVFEVRHPSNAEGKRLYEVVGPRLDEAKARAREVYGETTPRVTSVGRTLDEVIEEWRKLRDVRPASASTYDTLVRLYVTPKLGRRKVRDLDEAAILHWLRGLKGQRGQELSDSTRRLLLSTLDAIFQRAIRMGAASVNPVRSLDKRDRPKQGPPRRRILSADEEARLLAYCARTPWLRPVVSVAIGEALRLGELLGLDWQDVDFVAGKLHVRRAVDRRGNIGPCKGQSREDFERGKGASIELTPVARAALLELRLQAAEGPVFLSERGERRGSGDVQRAFRKARERAALPVTEEGKVVFHSLRHTGVSRLANHPAIPLVHVRDFARHTNLATTEGYVHRIDSPTITEAIGEALAG